MVNGGETPAFGPGHPFLERSMTDVIAGVFRIRLARQDFVLPVLTYGENDEWEATLDADLQPLIADETDAGQALELLKQYGDKLVDLIYAYDRTGVLPPIAELRPHIYPNEALLAVWEVRAALNPTLGLTLAAAFEETREEQAAAQATAEALRSAKRRSTSSSRRPTAGRSRKSAGSRSNSSSSSTSTRRRSD